MPARAGLPLSALDTIFPFHLILDPELRLLQVGPGWQKLDANLKSGGVLEGQLRCVRPRLKLTWEELLGAVGVMVVLEPPSGRYTLRGELLLVQEDRILFLGGPWVTDSGQLVALGLDLQDFAKHDRLPDLLHLLQMQKLTMADQEKLVTRLTQQRKELEAAQSLLESQRELLRVRVADLERAESINRSILETAADAIVTIDGEGVVQRVNTAFEHMLGYPAPEIIGHSITRIMEPTDAAEHQAHVQRYMDTGEGRIIGRGREVVGRRADGRQVPLFLSVGDCRVGDQRLFTGILRDITDLLEQRVALGQAREQEVAIASQIQGLLLFGNLPVHLDELDFGVLVAPSQGVDGDFYDFLRVGPDCLDLVVGDVMGKGISAALLGAAVKAHLQRALGQLLAEGRRLPDVAQLVNRLHVRISDLLVTLGSFVTAGYARFHLSTGKLEYVDCGHTPVLHMRADRKASWLKGENVPLGFLPQEHYESRQLDLEPGDLLVFYSDGVVEAATPQGEHYGQERLAELVAANWELDPRALVQKLEVDLLSFAGSLGQDDRTCVFVRVGPRPSRPPLGYRELEIASDPFRLPLLRDFVRSVCVDYHPEMTAQDRFWLELAVTEVATNIFRHAYRGRRDGWLRLAAEPTLEEVTIRIYHTGVPLDPERSGPVLEGPQEGGMGLFLIEQSVDRLEYSTDCRGRHCVLLARRLPRSDGI